MVHGTVHGTWRFTIFQIFCPEAPNECRRTRTNSGRSGHLFVIRLGRAWSLMTCWLIWVPTIELTGADQSVSARADKITKIGLHFRLSTLEDERNLLYMRHCIYLIWGLLLHYILDIWSMVLSKENWPYNQKDHLTDINDWPYVKYLGPYIR